MTRHIRMGALASFVLLTTLASAQLTNLLQPASSSSTSSAPTDPLNRTTPSGSILGFLQAAQAGNYSIAAQYLQMSAARRQSEGDELASELNTVMNRACACPLSRVSSQPEGTPQETEPPGRQKIGTMSSPDLDVDLELVRVNDPNAGKVWLVSSETLAKVPELYDQVEARQVESKLPSFFVKHQFGGMPLWQWLALLLALPFAAALGWIVVRVAEIPLGWWARRRGQIDVANWRTVSGPAWMLVATLAHQFFTFRYLGIALLPRHYYYQITSVALIASATWILWRFVRWSLRRGRNRALAMGHAGTSSLMVLGERILKAVIFLAGIFAILASLGFDLRTALAGLGIGGLAIGFGAQQTIANLFGGVSVLGDEVLRVGDVCRIGDRTGTVEDIGLRSTRIRTDERTLLAIPNGTVASVNVENLSRREKLLLKTTLGLRLESTSDHVRFITSEIRKMLYSHPKIETKSVRVRLTDISGTNLAVEVFSYVLTKDFNEFAAVREDLLLRMMDITAESGSGLALPSQTLYLSRDSGLEKEKADAAAKKIADLRDGKKLPFPDHHPDDVSSFKGSIQYPPAGSAVRKDSDPH